MVVNDDDAALIERHVIVAGNRSLGQGAMVAFGSAAVALVILVVARVATGNSFWDVPAAFVVIAGVFALIIGLAARRQRVHGTTAWLLLLPFVSLPTAFFLLAEIVYPFGAATVITGPFSYLYCFLVAVTGFLQNPRLSLVAGVVAAVQLIAVFLIAQENLQTVVTPDAYLNDELRTPFLWANRALMIAFVGVGVAGSASVARGLVHQALLEERERARVSRLFGQYVSHEVKERILQSGSALRGERREVVMLFSDLRGFSKFSEGKDPAVVVERLNAYFERMVTAIEREGGVVDKFIGDAVMACFGGLVPVDDPAGAAVRAARGMRQGLAELNAQWAKEGIEPFDNGIGLHIGEVIQGPLGSEQRREFTVIGDAVNTASRLEGLTKEKQKAILVTAALFERLAPADRAGFDLVGEVHVKGKAELLTIYGAGASPQ